jgi:pimeloyl-ACP methyl ester carboxylesterase
MNKPPLLMIHGLVGTLDYFDPRRRIESAEVHTIDLLGFGSQRERRSGGGADARGGLTLQSQVEHVASWMVSRSSGPVWLLGHSMGGAVAMLAADQHPELVSGIINVEGNFTLKDAFWSSAIIAKSPKEWSKEYREMLRDVPLWLTRCGIEPTAQRVRWATGILESQPADTVYAMSKALVEETRVPTYLDAVHRVIDGDVPIHLIAGARSARDWDVPRFVRAAARSYIEIARAGHIMMLEEPEAFCRAVDTIIVTV